MALYDSREFVLAFHTGRMDVLAYIQRNVRTGYWDFDYCNKVTKDSLDLPKPPAPLIGDTRELAIRSLNTFVSMMGYKRK